MLIAGFSLLRNPPIINSLVKCDYLLEIADSIDLMILKVAIFWNAPRATIPNPNVP
jgi:hypothetical protein